MTNRILVVAPHPDDEILGCGGTLLRRKAEGATLAWLIVTQVAESGGFSRERVESRRAEIDRVAELVGFDEVFRLEWPTTRLDEVPKADLVGSISAVFKAFAPDEVLVPNRSDAHSDHMVVFDAVAACTKWFRYPSVQRVLVYETISETEFGMDPDSSFRPNVFVDIGGYLERKLEIMMVYASEVHPFPFPRSLEALRALAVVRGSTAGFAAAEAFQLLRARE